VTASPVVADAADPATAGGSSRIPAALAGAVRRAAPRMGPLTDHTWESFSQNWNVDVAQAFTDPSRAAAPAVAGSCVIAMSSGAAVNGSPLSGAMRR